MTKSKLALLAFTLVYFGCDGTSSTIPIDANTPKDAAGADAGEARDADLFEGGVDAVVDAIGGADDAGASDASDGSVDAGTVDATNGDVDADRIDASQVDASACVAGTACMIDPGVDGSVATLAGVCDVAGACGGCAQDGATGDAQCAGAYGAGHRCLPSGIGSTLACRLAACRDSFDCAAGKTCSGYECTPCASDAICQADVRYGTGTLCNGVDCVPGDCHTSADCVGPRDGQLCGLTTPNTCGDCNADAQCASDAVRGATAPICGGGSSRRCISDVCVPSLTSTAALCSGGDVCCPTMVASGQCIPDTAGVTSCCSTAQCPTRSTCVDHVCTMCSDVSAVGPGANTFYVDPVGGSDTGTGILTNGCRLASITAAMAKVRARVAAGNSGASTIILMGTASGSTGEAFPIVVEDNVSIRGGDPSSSDPAMSPAMQTIRVNDATTGFVVASSNVTLSFVEVDGAAVGGGTAGLRGLRIYAPAGQSQTGVSLTQSRVRNFAGDALTVGDGAVAGLLGGSATLGPGFEALQSGTGLLVRGTAAVAIVGGSGTANGVALQTRFAGNAAAGMRVTELGSVSVVGTADAMPARANTGTGVSTSTIVFLDNCNDGPGVAGCAAVDVAQDPALGVVPTNSIDGMHVYFSSATSGSAVHGVRIEPGSAVLMRRSVVLGAGASGILVPSASIGGSSDVSRIDLGTVASPGQNLLQVPRSSTSVTANGNVGICFLTAGQTLTAIGNVFVSISSNLVDCSSSTGTIAEVRTGGCVPSGSTYTWAIGRVTAPISNANTVNVAFCTLSAQ